MPAGLVGGARDLVGGMGELALELDLGGLGCGRQLSHIHPAFVSATLDTGL
jgi:hypothetical protein